MKSKLTIIALPVCMFLFALGGKVISNENIGPDAPIRGGAANKISSQTLHQGLPFEVREESLFMMADN